MENEVPISAVNVCMDSEEQPNENHDFKRYKLSQVLSSFEQKLREKGTCFVNDARLTLFPWTQALVSVEENLNHTRLAFKEMEETLKTENRNMCEMLANEICLRNQREQEFREKESMLEETKKTLEKEKISRNNAEEELEEAKSVSMLMKIEMCEAKRKLRETEGLLDKLSQSLAEEERLRTGMEEELKQETLSCAELKKRLEIERLTNQSYQEVVRTKEEAFKVQLLQLKQEQKQKTALERTLSRLETQMEVERNRLILNQTALSAAQEKLSEYERRQPGTIPRGEIALGEKILSRGDGGNVRKGTFGFLLPTYWILQPKDSQDLEKTVHLVELDRASGTQEYKNVQDRFRKTCPNQIVKIERVQNPALFGMYMIRKQKMDKAKGSNELWLFHGTAATMYGNGVYFAEDASYSAQSKYSPADASGQRYMYLSRVLVGEFTLGKQGLLTPPAKNPNDLTDTYDSVVNKIPNPKIFVVFYDWQCYPEYLITFR
ncbi:Poly [ADP-ribose] polymerase 15 [Stylophora pistillata]|uniref:Poly [ADP-ribose] polymerase n=1 Tax=Stylophora pistillata TaxID=50429 RepID=A0A2B4SFU6_STYPI|nr:Poly [ADP-ribose] polymerase 15 [Stylophora pistillata]